MLKAQLCIAAVVAMCVAGGIAGESASAAFILSETNVAKVKSHFAGTALKKVVTYAS